MKDVYGEGMGAARRIRATNFFPPVAAACFPPLLLELSSHCTWRSYQVLCGVK